MIVTANCLICGAPLPPSKTKPRKYCSKQCAIKGFHLGASRCKVTTNCLICGAPLKPGKTCPRKYCSQKCAKRASRMGLSHMTPDEIAQVFVAPPPRRQIEVGRETASITVEERDLRNSELGQIVRVETRGRIPVGWRSACTVKHI